MRVPTADDVRAAAERLRGTAVRTPVLLDRELSARTGAAVFVKCENLQIGGAFKFRGAYNRLVQLDAGARTRGVVAWSSGNHAQGVAAAGRLLGIPATIVMPADAPRIKIDRTQAYGANVVLYDRLSQDREAIGRSIAAQLGATVVPPYDDPDIIAGQGTAGLEFAEEVRARTGDDLAALLVPCSGGGLIAGCALALGEVSPATRVHPVEPLGYDSMGASLRARSRTHLPPAPPSICDSLLAPQPGEITWAVDRERLAPGFAVTDEQVQDAQRHAWRSLKLVVEPGGAAALAAVLAGLVDVGAGSVGIVLSGGNADPGPFARTLSQEDPGAG